ncbi:MAG: hypothetical protein KTR26_02760 [Flammeovirgaceae bacterium]|nr:hypothetical protein [Flammeovirgaceae bacterium]
MNKLLQSICQGQKQLVLTLNVNAHDEPAPFWELLLISIFAFYIFTLIHKEEPKPPKKADHLLDQLTKEIEVEQINAFSKAGGKLIRNEKEETEAFVSIVRFEDWLTKTPKKKSLIRRLFSLFRF